jgi:hypothetical protein
VEQLQTRFDNASTTHDSKLTREQAQAVMPLVVKHFDEIDTAKAGYVTTSQIEGFLALSELTVRRTATIGGIRRLVRDQRCIEARVGRSPAPSRMHCFLQLIATFRLVRERLGRISAELGQAPGS